MEAAFLREGNLFGCLCACAD